MIKLETDRLVIRDYQQEDVDLYYRLKSNDKTMYYLQDLKASSLQESVEDFKTILDDTKTDCRKMYFLHMELKNSQEQIGSIGYTVTADTPLGKLVHLGYFTYPQYWGKGYVTEALTMLMEYAFLENNVYRITTGCLKENIGSERVMQKCGFIKEAEHLDYEWHDGRMKTRVEYRILKNEWSKK